jgi:hypothetical protein
VLARLLKLNHERWEQEQRNGTTKDAKKGATSSRSSYGKKAKKTGENPGQVGLF